ncbi:MAG: hypothetical protein AAB851_03485 [Patescibacteria group bacterium]
MVKKIKYLIPSLASALPMAAFAQIGRERATQVVGGVSDIFLIIDRIVNYFLAFVLAISVIMIIYAGFNFMKGSEEGITAGKQTLTYAIVGIIVAVLAYSVKAVVMSILQA